MPRMFLDVVADLVGQDVRLRKFAGRAEALPELVVEAEIDVNLFVAGTVEGARGRFGAAAGCMRVIAEEDEPGVVIRLAGLLREKLRPSVLRVVKDERNELDERLFRRIPCRIRAADRRRAGTRAAAAEQGEEILLEDKAKDEQDDGATDADVHAAELESAATPGFVAAIFNVLAFVAGYPAHDFFSSVPVSRNGSTRVCASECVRGDRMTDCEAEKK
jgi:hypothetical protein